MPDEITWPAWLLVLVGLGAAAGAATGIIAFLKQTGRGMRTMTAYLGGIVRREVTEIVDSRVARGIDDLEAKIAPALAHLVAEHTPNGGSSTRDAITRIDTVVQQLAHDLAQHITHSRLDRADLRRWLETIDPGRASRLPWPLDYEPSEDDDPEAPPDGGASS